MPNIAYLRGGSVLALLLSSGLAGQAFAQTAPEPVVHSVDEIVVTAQRRTQSLQDVPIVVTAVSRQLLKDTGVKDIKDLTIVVPGLMVTSTSSEASTTARIRGIGTVGDNLGLESSVGVQIDGVYRPRNSVSFGDLGDIRRIEVLKGPQGTLFGKNTSAGVINILTQRPSFEFGAEAEATASNFNGYGASASVTGALSPDKVAGRLFVAARKRDGFYDVKVGSGPRTRTDDQNQNFQTIRGQLLFTPTDAFDFNVIADHTSRNENCCAAVQIFDGPTAALIQAIDPAPLGASHGGLAKPVDPYARIAYLNRNTTQDIKEGGVSGEANWRTDWLGGATLTSITAYRDWKRNYALDGDYTSVDIFYYGDGPQNRSEFKQFSQELRLAGHQDKLDWLVGVFYANEQLLQNAALRYGKDFETYGSLLFSGGTNPTLISALEGRAPGTSFAVGQGQKDRYDQQESNIALFTNNTFRVTDKLELTGGLRYTHEHKTLDTLYDNTDTGLGCGTLQARLGQSPTAVATSALLCTTFANSLFNNLAAHQTLTEEEVTGTIKAAYRFNPQILTYASYARGYKAGGFNLDRQACPYSTASAVSAACVASIAKSGHTLVVNPSQSAANQGALQPLYDTSFKPEFVDSYELGIKNTLLDRKLLLNATAFYQKFSGFQLNAFNGLTFAVTSIPEVTTKGVDLDLIYMPMQGLSILAGVTYADTRYASKDASVLGPPCTSIVYGAVAGAPAGCSLLPGQRLSLAPLYSSSLAVTYEHDVTDNLVARFNVAAKALSTYNTGSDLNPVKVQKGFTLVNARVGIGPGDERWAFEVWSLNLFDKQYYQVGFDAPTQSGTYTAFLGQPRTYGATLRARF